MTPERWQHIDTLLGEALELESTRRAQFLDHACGGDEELRHRLDALLAAHEKAGSFIEVPALAATAQALARETMIGRQLGQYHVSAFIGAGGMGAVWKAKDTRLGRDVAIKTLPEGFAQHRDRLNRFEREAKLLASVNHANIAMVYGLHEDQGLRFLVLELVEGETLADRLRHGAIPLEESLKLARQISCALEAAHEKGIIHRDLKPTNIKITEDGTVKVLDFGLAKALAGDEAHVELADSPTPRMDSTESGIIVGTAGYMAPEQARGRRVDKRADIWAFGVVLYEMVTGTRAFQGADPTETLASVVMKEADFGPVPFRLRRLLRKCLEKDPKNRLRDIADVWELLDDPAAAADAPHSLAGRRDALRWIVASVVGFVAGMFSLRWLKPHPLPEVERFSIYAPPESKLPLGTPAFSHDGRKLAYTVIDPDGLTRIHVRAIDSLQSRALRGTEGALHPFWSPGGDFLAFTAERKLKSINLATESVHDLIENGFIWQGAWGKNDDILVHAGHELFRIPSQGGTPKPIPNSSGLAFPEFLPDGRRFLARISDKNGNSIQFGSLESGKRTTVVDNIVSAPILAPTPGGKTYLLFLKDSDLFVQEFEEATGKVLGVPSVLVARIGHVDSSWVRPAVGVSPTGHLAYQNASPGPAQLTWVNESGQTIQTLSPEASVIKPRVSPDQSSLAGSKTSEAGGDDIWVMDLGNKIPPRRKTFKDSFERFAVWSHDSKRLAYLQLQSGILALNVDGSEEPELLTPKPGVPTSWSRQHLLYNLGNTIYLLDLADKNSIPVGLPNGSSSEGEFSPDGNHIAFNSNSSGRYEVYVRPLPPGTGERQVSTNGGGEARWSGDGKKIFFVSPDGYLMVTDIEFGEAISVGTPKRLFSFHNRDGYAVVSDGYDVSRDGRRFLIVSRAEERSAPITIVTNWWVDFEKRDGR